MPIQVCPSDIVCASVDRVWDALTIPSELERWTETRILAGPARALQVGDRLVLGVGPGHRLKVYFDVVEVERPASLAIDIRLPLGVRNHEVIRISPLSTCECRVTFN